MALLQKIKEALGFGSAPAERDEADTEVTVEHEPEDANAEPVGSGSSDGSDGEGEPVAAETDAAASTPAPDFAPTMYSSIHARTPPLAPAATTPAPALFRRSRRDQLRCTIRALVVAR